MHANFILNVVIIYNPQNVIAFNGSNISLIKAKIENEIKNEKWKKKWPKHFQEKIFDFIF